MQLFRLKTALSLEQADKIIDAAIAAGREAGFQPLTVAVLDTGGHLIALKREDGSGIVRTDVAIGKAWGALGMGMASRALGEANKERPAFLNALAAASAGRTVPVPGGVLICDDQDQVIGAVGISGDNSDNDEHCALAGVKACELKPVAGG